MVTATIEAHATAIAATTAGSPIQGAVSGSRRIARPPPSIGVGRQTCRSTIGACSAHSRTRNTPTGTAIA
jgi:hypothetical protein